MNKLDNKKNLDNKSADVEIYSGYTRSSFFQDGYNNESLQIMRRFAKSYFDNNFLQHLPKDKSVTILEIGCGNGRYIERLRSLGYKNVTGIDISEDQINFAKNELGLNCVYQYDAIPWLENDDKKYDVIFCLDVMEHLELDDLMSITNSIMKSLKANGNVIVQVPNSISPFSPVFHGDLTHKRAFTKTSLKQLFAHNGFTKVAIYESKIKNSSFFTKIRQFIYSFLLRPIFYLCSVIIHGRDEAGNYTQNLIAVISK